MTMSAQTLSPLNDESRCPSGCSAGRRIGAANGEDVYECPACGLLYYSASVRARPSIDGNWYAHDIDLGGTLAQASMANLRPYLARQVRAAGKTTSNRTVLDVGAGMGLFLAAAAEAGWDATGLDSNPSAAAVANRAFGLTYVSDLAEIADSSQGLVRLSHVLEHVADPVGFLSGLRRTLLPDGTVMVIVPNGRPLFYSLINAGRRQLRNDRLATPMNPGFHLLGFTVKSLHHAAQTAGYSVSEIFTVGMGNPTYYPMLYDGLTEIKPWSDLLRPGAARRWLPQLVDNFGAPFGRGHWIVGFLRP